MRNSLMVVCLAMFAVPALPHGGGLNAEGCHNNRKSGDYHCHRAPSIPRPIDKPRPDDVRQPPAAKFAPARREPSTPACYTGPRGGTYTITPSGRKNYSGC